MATLTKPVPLPYMFSIYDEIGARYRCEANWNNPGPKFWTDVAPRLWEHTSTPPTSQDGMMGMLLQDAYEAAQALLDSQVRPVHGADVVICSCEEYAPAWVFGYNSRRFLVDMDIVASLVGNGPVVVPKSGEAPYLGLSSRPISEQLREGE